MVTPGAGVFEWNGFLPACLCALTKLRALSWTLLVWFLENTLPLVNHKKAGYRILQRAMGECVTGCLIVP